MYVKKPSVTAKVCRDRRVHILMYKKYLADYPFRIRSPLCFGRLVAQEEYAWLRQARLHFEGAIGDQRGYVTAASLKQMHSWVRAGAIVDGFGMEIRRKRGVETQGILRQTPR